MRPLAGVFAFLHQFSLDRRKGFEGVCGEAVVALPLGQGYASHQARAGKLGLHAVVILRAHHAEHLVVGDALQDGPIYRAINVAVRYKARRALATLSPQ